MYSKLFAVLFSSSMLFALVGCAKKVEQQNGVTRVKVTAHKYSFEPSEIHVKKGQQVELEITTSDVQHGFEVKDLGIDESIQKGKPTIITFKADKAGKFDLECDIVCGPGHDGMEGKIIVE